MKKLSLPRLGRFGLACAGLAGALMLNACGGGDLVTTFQPGRVLVFGDEGSVLTPTGARYGINGLTAGDSTAVPPVLPTFNCGLNPIWVQVLTGHYNMGFAECPNNLDTATPRGRIFAAADTGVAELAAQITAAAGAAGFTNSDLTTVYTGQKDIIAAYQAMSSGADIGNARAAGEAAGTALAQQVNRLADAGARVLIVTVPNVGITPFALAEQAARPDFDRVDALRQITERFNAKLRSTIYNDGRRIGLIQLDEYVGVVMSYPPGYGYANWTQPACTVALPNCTSETLVTGATSGNYLFADDRRVGPGAQLQTGNLAVQRAVNNPF
ncbi:SGNH/GDSL hydrolase family protein [Rivibacter subsaxonicus]|uniref:Phospholipase/lecithinase/hemolysin n=1 Tax=Rivibacter subsaxonicus TaxID=457575 RepID=A0A4Q7VVG4_9BURK|nr:SGNH/GDSL hydrolase family protein [Rivibacter subsaxonicus]RZU00573.1 phospholipase/lecithinase/hemolysin [Rivibacter subsaxonicus]